MSLCSTRPPPVGSDWGCNRKLRSEDRLIVLGRPRLRCVSNIVVEILDCQLGDSLSSRGLFGLVRAELGNDLLFGFDLSDEK